MLNPKRLHNIALYYLKRYDSSSFALRKVLHRRVYKERLKDIDIPENINQIIEDIISKMVELGYINDRRFLENQVGKLERQGRSRYYITKKLLEVGYKEDDFRDYLKECLEDDLSLALRFIKKHRLFKVEERYQKDLAKLGRNGFSYLVSSKAAVIFREEEG